MRSPAENRSQKLRSVKIFVFRGFLHRLVLGGQCGHGLHVGNLIGCLGCPLRTRGAPIRELVQSGLTTLL